MQVLVSDIEWEADHVDEVSQLPNEMTVEVDELDEAIDKVSDETGFLIRSANTEVVDSKEVDVVVDLRSVRIQADEADIAGFYDGDVKCQARIYMALEEKLAEMMDAKFVGDGLIENLEVEDE
jgi:hypothetical protein